jgi:hypothetical protein
MNKNEKRLNQFRSKFETWDDERIKQIFNRLNQGEVCTFATTSLSSKDQNVTEIQKTITELKPSNHFDEFQTVNSITQYVFYWWDSIQSLLVINKKQDEYLQFKNWFMKLLNTDCENNGLCWENNDCFIVEWEELTGEYSHEEMWSLLEEEELV